MVVPFQLPINAWTSGRRRAVLYRAHGELAAPSTSGTSTPPPFNVEPQESSLAPMNRLELIEMQDEAGSDVRFATQLDDSDRWRERDA
jgi:hypothetical protein